MWHQSDAQENGFSRKSLPTLTFKQFWERERHCSLIARVDEYGDVPTVELQGVQNSPIPNHERIVWFAAYDR